MNSDLAKFRGSGMMALFPFPSMRVYVLLYDAGCEVEGIHSLDLAGRTIVLLFEDADDAQRYAGLLEAQDFPSPTVQSIDRGEVEHFCREARYEARVVPCGFRPVSAEDRLMLLPPERNLEVDGWRDEEAAGTTDMSAGTEEAGGEDTDRNNPELEAFRGRLESLL